MATISIPSGSPTLASWLLALRKAATDGKVPESFETLTQPQLLQACRKASVPVIEGRIDSRYQGEVYFALREMLDVPVRWEQVGQWEDWVTTEIAGERVDVMTCLVHEGAGVYVSGNGRPTSGLFAHHDETFEGA